MIDNSESRMWADHGHQFSDQVANAFSKAFLAFERLHAIQFDAPWQSQARRGRRTGRA
jgi:hypothetical protein